MKLLKALEIGKECGMKTVGDALLNIAMHAMNIFNYSEMKSELLEMYNEFKSTGWNQEDNIEECIEKIKNNLHNKGE